MGGMLVVYGFGFGGILFGVCIGRLLCVGVDVWGGMGWSVGCCGLVCFWGWGYMGDGVGMWWGGLGGCVVCGVIVGGLGFGVGLFVWGGGFGYFWVCSGVVVIFSGGGGCLGVGCVVLWWWRRVYVVVCGCD
uniref:NADH dehydrogenase subunit 6 n=1 Tax=Knipowitschia caucasica TaxID=637954 RepID=A0AAV2M448_KNICA